MLKIEHLKKSYENFSLDCSLEVKRGHVTGLIGQNGAGKSTTFKAILGLISYEHGDITILGKPLAQFTAKDKQDLGVVLSDSGFSGYLTINDILPIMENLYKNFDKSFFLEQVEKFQLPCDKKIKDFSTGMKAKVKVLTAISHHAKLLILDEPTAGLDVIARDELLELLRDFMAKEDGNSILISSHISSDLESICDDLYMIHQGTIILHEDTDVLLSDYALLKVDDEAYAGLDKQYLLRSKKESYGYSCLTNQKQYYAENYPQIAIEKGTIDVYKRQLLSHPPLGLCSPALQNCHIPGRQCCHQYVPDIPDSQTPVSAYMRSCAHRPPALSTLPAHRMQAFLTAQPHISTVPLRVH